MGKRKYYADYYSSNQASFFITNGYSALLCLAVVMNRVQGATKDLIKNNIGDPSPKSPCLLSLYLLGSNVIRKLQQIIIVTGAVNCNSKTVMMTYLVVFSRLRQSGYLLLLFIHQNRS